MKALSTLESSTSTRPGGRRLPRPSIERSGSETHLGFSLIEVVIALLVIMIVLLGVFAALNYSITYNAGNKARSQALAVMQQEVEQVRSAKFNATTTDTLLAGGTKATKNVDATNGMSFVVEMAVDNDPGVAGVQDETYQCLSPQGAPIDCTLKEIMIRVTLAAPSPGWQTAVPAQIVMRRVRGN